MAAIITDQIRVLMAKMFVERSTNPDNSYYTFIGLTNSEEILPTWDTNPPAPKDNLDEENNYWDTTIALKKITPNNIRHAIRKYQWESGVVYDMYRHDISRTNLSRPSKSTSLYRSPYYIINSDFRVYICLRNGSTPETPDGSPSLDEPTFTDLEPREAGSSGDGYIWKYLYTIKPSDIVKFDSIDFIPTPPNWSINEEYAPIRNNAKNSGQLKIITITNRGSGIGTANATYSNVPIRGDGTGGEATIVIDNDSKVESITVSKGGENYTYGTVDLQSGNVPLGTVTPTFDVIIPPKGGHGHDIYSELGAYHVLLYTRIENDETNPDFVTGNKISRIGIIENPTSYNSSSILINERASALHAIKLKGEPGTLLTASFESNSFVYQTIGVGQTAVGRVVSYDQETGVLKLWQDRTFVGFRTDGSRTNNIPFGYQLNKFTSFPQPGGNLTITGGSVNLEIDNNFTGVSTTINNEGNLKTYFLGQNFINGIAFPEVQKYSGTTLYVDNRPSITRSKSQKEDIKVILQF
jgi:hypothetical protein